MRADRDDQFSNLRPDLDEIESRAFVPRLQQRPPVDIGRAIIIAAVVLVLGYWVGTLLYDAIQEYRVEKAVRALVKGFEFNPPTGLNLSAPITGLQTEGDRIAQRHLERVRKENAQRERERAAQTLQAKQEKRLTSAECKFWWDQDRSNPTERTASKKRQHCGV